jgi:peptidoglycan/LPS O-acetylase OafA/YrhL
MSPQNSRIEYLDWLRALAAGLVLVGHYANPLVRGGAIGVSVFFVLSGYLITSILLRDGMFTAQNVAKFIVRRIARIYPLYVVQIALGVLVCGLFQRDKFSAAVDAVPGLLSFTSNPPEWLGYGFGVLWTLGIEFWFYVSFPLLLWGATLTGRVVPWIVGGIALSLTAKAMNFGGETLAYYDQFLLGALCAIAIKSQRIPWFAFSPGCFVACILAILIIAQIPFPGWHTVLWYCQSLATAAVTALAILAGAARTPRLQLPLLAFFGRISYSVYLMHAVLLDVLVLGLPWARKFPFFLVSIPLFVVATLAVSVVTYRFIERPFETAARKRIRYKMA